MLRQLCFYPYEARRGMRVADDAPHSNSCNSCMVCLEHLFTSKRWEASQRQAVLWWVMSCWFPTCNSALTSLPLWYVSVFPVSRLFFFLLFLQFFILYFHIFCHVCFWLISIRKLTTVALNWQMFCKHLFSDLPQGFNDPRSWREASMRNETVTPATLLHLCSNESK